MDFNEFGLSPELKRAIDDLGFTEPTPIQQKAIPLVMHGVDVMGLAQTGTGKTAAYVLPLLNRLMHGSRRRARALIVAPTRELAEQIHDATMQLGSHAGLKSVVIYGGVNINTQKSALRNMRAEVVVGCPGRLLDLLGQGVLNLSQVEVLVLDEADRMLDMGFMPDIRRLLKYVPPRRQTLMFSATMPDEIRRLCGEIMSEFVTVQIGRTSPAKNVNHELYPVKDHLKTALLRALLRRTGDGSVIVFTRTKIKADRLGHTLKRAGLSVVSLQGDMSQPRRQAALDGFRDGTYRVLVATDVAARGIDVEDITHVINFDLPDNTEDYIHRVGRTGRASKKGTAFSIVTSADAPIVRAMERELEVELVSMELDDFDYNVPPPDGYRQHHQKGERKHESHAKRKGGSGRKRGGSGRGGGGTKQKAEGGPGVE